MSGPKDPFREWFDRIDAEELTAMNNRRDEESFNLDFKRMAQSGEPSDDDKQNLSKAISGYANSAGGIVLWGVESKSDTDRRDRSRFHELVPVKNGERAAVRFHELTAAATQPPVNGVVHKAISVEGGFVVKTFVPASDSGPHRTNEVNGQYYRRDADAFRAMQHHEIADMFGRRARPHLGLVLVRALVLDYEDASHVSRVCIASIGNEGRGIAKHPLIIIVPKNGTVVPMDRGAMQLTRLIEQGHRGFHYVETGTCVIHPESETSLDWIRLEATRTEPVAFDFKIYAEGMQLQIGSVEFSDEQLRSWGEQQRWRSTSGSIE